MMATQRDAESRINLAVVNLKDLGADPTDVQDGDIWINTGVLKVRLGGATKTVTVS